MNHQLFSLIALTIANERAAEADQYRRWAAATEGEEPSPSLPRRSLARFMATISRSSAWAVRKLDSCIADDLGRSLAPSE